LQPPLSSKFQKRLLREYTNQQSRCCIYNIRCCFCRNSVVLDVRATNWPSYWQLRIVACVMQNFKSCQCTSCCHSKYVCVFCGVCSRNVPLYFKSSIKFPAIFEQSLGSYRPRVCYSFVALILHPSSCIHF